MKQGDIVAYIGCSIEQIKWGGNDSPEGILNIGQQYVVEKVEPHTWHTKIHLKGIPGRYNSVCFEIIN